VTESLSMQVLDEAGCRARFPEWFGYSYTVGRMPARPSGLHLAWLLAKQSWLLVVAVAAVPVWLALR
jgi:hypothetical protein